MPKRYSSREVLTALHKGGFVEVSQRGSHLKLRRDAGGRRLTVIVKHPDPVVPIGAFRAILKQAALTVAESEALPHS